MDGPLESSTNPMMQPRECVTPPPNLSLQGKILGFTSSINTPPIAEIMGQKYEGNCGLWVLNEII